MEKQRKRERQGVTDTGVERFAPVCLTYPTTIRIYRSVPPWMATDYRMEIGELGPWSITHNNDQNTPVSAN